MKKLLLESVTKSFIFCVMLYITLSLFTFNLQLQSLDISTGKITTAYDIVQVNTFVENLRSYIFEK